MMPRILLQGLACALLLAAAQAAQAVNFNMTCTAASSTLAFNPYDVLAGTDTTDPTGTITISCTSTHNSAAVTVSYSLSLSTTPTRVLTLDVSNTLTYDLYTDSQRTIPWNTTNLITGSFSVPIKSTATQNVSYYGKIPGGSDRPAGTYSQTGLAVTLTYSCSPAPTGGGTC